jgi:[protein-PII] uridylyltransferase
MEYLAGDTPALDLEEHLEQRRQEIRSHLGLVAEEPWFIRQVDSLPTAYLSGTGPQQIADDLRRLADLKPGELDVQFEYLPETETVEITVSTSEDITPGVFHKLTGALTSQGLAILSANINTLGAGLVLDRFRVEDPDYVGEPPPERLDQIRQKVAESLSGTDRGTPRWRRVWQMGSGDGPAIPPVRNQVRIDNNTSDICTVLDVFAADRPGLLYTVARALFELDLSVWRAKIGTFLDQVVDVFYVTDRRGRKIEDEAQLDRIRCRLLEAIEGLSQQHSPIRG